MKLKWLTGPVVEILEWGRSYIIKGPNGKRYRRNRAHLKPLCHDGTSFQDPPKVQKKKLCKSDNVDSFWDPRPKPMKWVMFQDRMTVVPLFKYTAETGKMSNTKSTSHSSHHVHSPHSPLIITSTALTQRASSESQHRGPHCTQTANNHPTPRRWHAADIRTCSSCSRNITPSTLQNSMFRQKKSKTDA